MNKFKLVVLAAILFTLSVPSVLSKNTDVSSQQVLAVSQKPKQKVQARQSSQTQIQAAVALTNDLETKTSVSPSAASSTIASISKEPAPTQVKIKNEVPASATLTVPTTPETKTVEVVKPIAKVPTPIAPVLAPTQAPTPANAPAPITCGTGSFNDQFLCLINQYRVASGKSTLNFDGTLAAVALSHSQDMKNNNYFSHIGQDNSKFTDRCARMATQCFGEILAKGFTSPQKLFEIWKNSPPHNAIMLGSYQQMGLGVADKYATCLFR